MQRKERKEKNLKREKQGFEESPCHAVLP